MRYEGKRVNEKTEEDRRRTLQHRVKVTANLEAFRDTDVTFLLAEGPILHTEGKS